MTAFRNPNTRTAVFVLVIALFMALNIAEFPAIQKAGNYTSIHAQHGLAVRNYVDRVGARKQIDRNWYAYELVERHFRGWTIITHELFPGLFSEMYTYEFGGIKATRVARYDPKLNAEEARRLRALGIWRGEFLRLKGIFVIVPPEPASPPGRAVILRHGATVFLAPEARAPTRMVIPE